MTKPADLTAAAVEFAKSGLPASLWPRVLEASLGGTACSDCGMPMAADDSLICAGCVEATYLAEQRNPHA